MSPAAHRASVFRWGSSFAAALLAVCGLGTSFAQKLYVPGEEATIEALVLGGETVDLAEGVFDLPGSWRLTRPVRINGAGSGLTVLRFGLLEPGTEAAVEWSGSGLLVLSSLTVQLSTDSSGADIMRATAGLVELRDVELTGGRSGGGEKAGVGLRLEDRAEALLSGSTVTLNAAGVHVDGWTILRLESSEVTNNASDGVIAAGQSSVHVIDSSIASNGGAGIHLLDHAWATVLRSVLGNNSADGLRIDEYAKGLVLESLVSENQGFGIKLVDHSWVTAQGNVVAANSSGGVVVGRLARSTLVDNVIERNNSHGLAASDSASLVVLDNLFRENDGSGVVIGGGAAGTFAANFLVGNTEAAFVCQDDAKAVMMGNGLSGNGLDAGRVEASASCVEY